MICANLINGDHWGATQGLNLWNNVSKIEIKGSVVAFQEIDRWFFRKVDFDLVTIDIPQNEHGEKRDERGEDKVCTWIIPSTRKERGIVRVWSPDSATLIWMWVTSGSMYDVVAITYKDKNNSVTWATPFKL